MDDSTNPGNSSALVMASVATCITLLFALLFYAATKKPEPTPPHVDCDDCGAWIEMK